MPFIGNSDSQIVHTTDCEYADLIHPSNLEEFDDLWHALGQDYDECGWCLGRAREHEYKREIKASMRLVFSSDGCISCGENRGVQRAHIIPRRMGGVGTMPLCPTCHWNYDHNNLTENEAKRIRKHLLARDAR